MSGKWLAAMPRLQPQIFSYIWFGGRFKCPLYNKNWSECVVSDKRNNNLQDSLSNPTLVEFPLFLVGLCFPLFEREFNTGFQKYNSINSTQVGITLF